LILIDNFFDRESTKGLDEKDLKANLNSWANKSWRRETKEKTFRNLCWSQIRCSKAL